MYRTLGRGMLDNDLYLPQLRIPTRSGSSSPSRHYHAQSKTQSLAGKMSASQVQSDSEDDVNPSEFDYDTQLAYVLRTFFRAVTQ